MTSSSSSLRRRNSLPIGQAAVNASLKHQKEREELRRKEKVEASRQGRASNDDDMDPRDLERLHRQLSQLNFEEWLKQVRVCICIHVLHGCVGMYGKLLFLLQCVL